MKLTHQQLSKFWLLWARAEAEALPVSASKIDRDNLRHKTIMQATGKESLRDVGRTGDFESLMLAAALLAGDYKEASYWSIGKERRLVHMIGECARQIGEIAGVPHGWTYCRATFQQAGFPEAWMDIPEFMLESAFQMLDTHRRRLLTRDWHWAGSSEGQPLGFDPDYHYQILLGEMRLQHMHTHHAAVA
jgi:hypothetical protein